VRSFFLLLALTLATGARAFAAVPPDIEVIRFVAIPSDGPVTINNVAPAGRIVDDFRDIGPAKLVCAWFTNTAPATAKTIGIEFVYYDGAGNRFDGALLERKGTFSTGVRQFASARYNQRIFRDSCVTLKRPRNNFSAIVAYVDHVEFVDGTRWNAQDIRLADHVAPGSRNVAYDFTDPATARAPAVQLAANELAPLFIGTSPSCTSSAVTYVPSVFDPAVVSALTPARNVFVDARPGAPAMGNLFNIGNVTVCSKSGNADHDAAAIATVEGTHVAIRQEQVFRVYVPAISTSAGCTDDARLLNLVMLNATPVTEAEGPAKGGEYIGVVHVSVAPDGHASGATLVRSAGPPEFDDAVARSALASRYWPAISAGKRVLSGFDFAMRWVIAPGPVPNNVNQNQRTITRVYGPKFQPAATACAV
jgi:hypothetical protein